MEEVALQPDAIDAWIDRNAGKLHEYRGKQVAISLEEDRVVAAAEDLFELRRLIEAQGMQGKVAIEWLPDQ